MKKTIFATVALAFLFAPYLASACTLPNVWNPASIKGPLVTCTGDIANINNNNAKLPACASLSDLICTVTTDIYVGMAFVIWIILPISFIAGGIMYMLAGANPGMLTKAKSTLMGAVIGTIIVLCSYLLIATVVHFLNISNIGGFGAPIDLSTPPASAGGTCTPCGGSCCAPPQQCVAASPGIPGVPGTQQAAYCGTPGN